MSEYRQIFAIPVDVSFPIRDYPEGTGSYFRDIWGIGQDATVTSTGQSLRPLRQTKGNAQSRHSRAMSITLSSRADPRIPNPQTKWGRFKNGTWRALEMDSGKLSNLVDVDRSWSAATFVFDVNPGVAMLYQEPRRGKVEFFVNPQISSIYDTMDELSIVKDMMLEGDPKLATAHARQVFKGGYGLFIAIVAVEIKISKIADITR